MGNQKCDAADGDDDAVVMTPMCRRRPNNYLTRKGFNKYAY